MLSNRPEVTGFDYYDFAIFAEGSLHRSEDQRCHEFHTNEESDSEVQSLQTIWDKLEQNFDQKRLVSPQKIRHFIKRGIPRSLRGDFWQLLVGSRTLKNHATFDYQEKLAEVRNIMVDCGVTEYGGKKAAMLISHIIVGSFDDGETDETQSPRVDEEKRKKLTGFRQILLDADRTFPTHKMYIEGTTEGVEGRAALFRVLAVYTLYNPQVSYCQGMSYIAGMLLMNMGEEDAFWLLVSLFERPKYLSGYFDSSLSKIQRHSQVFERFLRQKMPKLYNHLKSNGIDALLFITPWFMALFTSLPCWDTVLTIWDLLLLDGISVIFQVSLAILHVLSDKLLAVSDMSLMLPMLLRLPPERIKRDYLVPVIWRWAIYNWEVDSALAIISDPNNNSLGKSETKRKILDDGNNRVKKKPRLMKENILTLERRNPSSLFQRFTNFLVNFLPSSLKENATSGLINTQRREETQSSTSSGDIFHFTGGPSSSKATCLSRPSPRKSRHHLASNENTKMLQNMKITSPLHRSPRVAIAQSKSKSINTLSAHDVVISSPNTEHAFKMFNTPKPMRISQISKTPTVLDSFEKSNLKQFSLSPDAELHNL